MVLSSDADNADSFNDYVAVLDEIHQAKNDEMYGKLRTGQGAWDEPLIMTITTASSGEDPANPEMQLYREWRGVVPSEFRRRMKKVKTKEEKSEEWFQKYI